MPTTDQPIPDSLIPDPDEVRIRLALVLTEADLLRSQLRVSKRLQRERVRLRELQKNGGPERAA
jgi:hypothetical protein